MKYRILGTVAAVALMASTSANALVIDDFTVTQILAATASGTVAAGIGGEREASITQNTGTSSVLDINNSSAGELLFANAGGQATVVVLYDGVGSGGFTATDLTVGGTQNAFEFIVTNSDFANFGWPSDSVRFRLCQLYGNRRFHGHRLDSDHLDQQPERQCRH
jgi:hypothetical protein